MGTNKYLVLFLFLGTQVFAQEAGHAPAAAHAPAAGHAAAHDAHAPAPVLAVSEKKADSEADTTLAEASCGVLESYGGIVQVMSEKLDRLIETKGKTLVPCGGWISTDAGWTILKHVKGFKIHLGAWSFIQVLKSEDDGDSVTLFRGELIGRSERGQGELRVVTANARTRIRAGMGLISYSNKDENTQMTMLHQQDRKMNSTFENRHVPGSGVDLKAGELSSMSLQMLRVVPTTPKVVAFNLLKPRLYEFHIEDKDILAVSKQMKSRADRKFASDFYIQDQDGEESNENVIHVKHAKTQKGESKGSRGVASVHGEQKKAFEKVDKAETLRKKREEAEHKAEKARLMQEMSRLTPDE